MIQPTKSMRQAVAEHSPWLPPKLEDAEIAALQALAKGSANADQQKRGIAAIIEKICATYDMSFRPGGEDGSRDTTFAEGRRFPGNQIVKALKTKLGTRRQE